jgi:predicted metal-dependent hydrolase
MPEVPAYEPRYLAGIVCFNRGDYFDAHEVWEDLWMECPAAERRFVQSLIQAAVALYHWNRGNQAGADRLFQSGRRYMEPYGPRYFGLEVAAFWADMERAFAGIPPRIALDPPPERWPDPDEIHHE